MGPDSVGTHGFPVVLGQASGLLQQVVRKGELPDIVKEGSPAEIDEIPPRKAHPFPELYGEFGNAAPVPFRFVSAKLQQADAGFDHGVDRGFQQAQGAVEGPKAHSPCSGFAKRAGQCFKQRGGFFRDGVSGG